MKVNLNNPLLVTVLFSAVAIGCIFFFKEKTPGVSPQEPIVLTKKSEAVSPVRKATPGTWPPALLPNNIPVNQIESKSKKIDAFSATGSPKDAFLAYTLISGCIKNRDFARSHPDFGIDVKNICGDITDSQIAMRNTYLRKALDANVPGAVSAFIALGPIEGDPRAIETRADDPIIVEWKTKALAMATDSAKSGDISSLSLLETNYQIGMLTAPDPKLALAYEIAKQEILSNRGVYKRKNGDLSSNLLTTLSSTLSKEQISEATDIGKSLAASCCKRGATF